MAEANRFFNYPYAAIEEALSNAVYHKAYDIREPIEDYRPVVLHADAGELCRMKRMKKSQVTTQRFIILYGVHVVKNTVRKQRCGIQHLIGYLLH